jgi:ribonuclease HI
MPVSKDKKKFYVVWRGREEGVYSTWSECFQQISGFSGAKYRAFESELAAQNAFRGSWEDSAKPESPASTESIKPVDWRLLTGEAKPVLPSWSVDASCMGNPGIMEYRGVDTDSGIELFRQGPFPLGTNNIGEFLAIVHALALLKKQGRPSVIYSDSKTAIAWVRHKKAKTSLKYNLKTRILFELISRAEKWLSENTWTTRILKWDTESWGEVPADFGRKSG